MDFEEIKSSKIYRTSPRKKRIYSTFQSTLGLVEQPESALPEHVRKQQKQKKAERKAENDNLEVEESQEEESEEGFGDGTPRAGHATSGSGAAPGDSDAGDVSDESESSESSSQDDVESSEEAYDRTDDLQSAAQNIKGMLNFRDDTKGVNYIRVQEKQDSSEMWIYYNDNINLNNIMGNVIELLNATDYRYLQFNRLARSDNAMVFVVLPDNMADEIKPMGEADEDIVTAVE